jgi:tetratricopeptide (TPR) repeat protein
VVAGELRPVARAGQRYPAALQHSGDPLLTDLVAWVPALQVSDVDDQLAGLAAVRPTVPPAMGGLGKVDDAARAQLEAARGALPAGTYVIGGAAPVAVSAGAWSWQRTDEVGLVEHARFDGTTWRRAYPELGLSISRADDGLAMAMASVYLPMAVPSADQLAAFYDVALASPRTVRLTPRKRGVDAELSLTFDAADHLVAVSAADGVALTSITWTAAGPTAVTIGGLTLPVVFTAASSATGNPIAPLPAGLMELRQPFGDPAARLVEASTLIVGSEAWRAAVRHGLAAAAVVRDARQAALLLAELRRGGALSLGEATLASGLVSGLGEVARATMRRELAPDAAALVAYLFDAPAASVIAPAAPAPGLVGTLATMRSLLRIADRSSSGGSVDTALALFAQLPVEAAVLRYLAAIAITERSALDRRALAPMWDALVSGRDRNIARADAAHWLGRSDRALGAERTIALLRDYDLTAAPVALDGSMRWSISGGAGGDAAWQLAWKAAVTRVLASDALEHVLAFATFGQTETSALLARAAVLAGDRPEAIEQVASLAMAQGQVAVAAGVLGRLPAGAPRSASLERLMAGLDAAQGRPAQAAAALERAVASDERAGIPPARLAGDLERLLTLYRDALRAAPAADQPGLLAALLAAVDRWRAAAPDDARVANVAGELLLELGHADEAWRQLSTQIERAPMDGAAWGVLAGVFTRAGQGERALTYWQEAVILDQTNPTPRLEQARLFYALGRDAEGDARLREIAGRRWHDRWSWVTYQAAQLQRERAAIR